MPEGGIHASPEPGRFLKPGEFESKAAAGKGILNKIAVAGSKLATPENITNAASMIPSKGAPKNTGGTPKPEPVDITDSSKVMPSTTPAAGPNHPGMSTATSGSGEGSSESTPLGRFGSAVMNKFNKTMGNSFFQGIKEKAESDRQAAADAEAAKKQEAADAESAKNQEWYDRQNHSHKNLTERMNLQAKLTEEKAAAAHARKLELLNGRQQSRATPVVPAPTVPGAVTPASEAAAAPAAKATRSRKPKATAAPTTEAPAAGAPAATPAQGKAEVKPGTPSTGGIMSKFDSNR